MTTEPATTGASEGTGQAPPTTPTTTPAASAAPATSTTPKFELKEGKMLVDGKSVVLESDLIASKKSLESAAEQAQTVHNDAIDKAKLGLSESQTAVAAANAKIQELEKARTTGAVSVEDTAKSKQDLEAAISRAETAETKSLELRRAHLALQYQIPAEQLQTKDMTQLDSFEEALKALATTRGGAGPYAIGGGAGGDAPKTPMDRATAILEATPVRGTRNAPPATT